jgi:hypothetical protein
MNLMAGAANTSLRACKELDARSRQVIPEILIVAKK